LKILSRTPPGPGGRHYRRLLSPILCVTADPLLDTSHSRSPPCVTSRCHQTLILYRSHIYTPPPPPPGVLIWPLIRLRHVYSISGSRFPCDRATFGAGRLSHDLFVTGEKNSIGCRTASPLTNPRRRDASMVDFQ